MTLQAAGGTEVFLQLVVYAVEEENMAPRCGVVLLREGSLKKKVEKKNDKKLVNIQNITEHNQRWTAQIVHAYFRSFH